MTRAGIAIATLLSIATATVVTGSVMTKAGATDGAQPNTSCATTTACIEGDNTSTGPGLKGTSAKGHGVVGTTKSKGTVNGNSHAGVLGQDLQAGGGVLNSGVEGSSINGTGVFGASTNGVGVQAASTNYLGVLASGDAFGVESLGITYGVGASGNTGVVGQGTSFGDAILAENDGGNLFRGNDQGLDKFVVDAGGNMSVAGFLSTSSSVDAAEGLFGSSSSGNPGVAGVSDFEAVEGENTSTSDAIFANGFGGLLFRGNNSLSEDVFEVDDAGDVFAVSYNSIADSTKLQHTSIGATVKTYSSQAAQPTLEDTGEAQLVNGVARVALDPTFATTIDRSDYVVLVTPQGMTQGMLCVAQRTPSGFVVQENMNGRSNVPFAYRIVAKPYGDAALRLPLASVPGHFGSRVAKTRISPRLYKATHHAAPIIKAPSLMH